MLIKIYNLINFHFPLRFLPCLFSLTKTPQFLRFFLCPKRKRHFAFPLFPFLFGPFLLSFFSNAISVFLHEVVLVIEILFEKAFGVLFQLGYFCIVFVCFSLDFFYVESGRLVFYCFVSKMVEDFLIFQD